MGVGALIIGIFVDGTPVEIDGPVLRRTCCEMGAPVSSCTPWRMATKGRQRMPALRFFMRRSGEATGDQLPFTVIATLCL